MVESLLLVVPAMLLCMLSPGPDLVLVLRNAWLGGKRHGLATSLGILTGNVVHIAYCALGVGWLIARSVVAYSVLKYAGAAYLIYLGVKALRRRDPSPAASASPRTAPRRAPHGGAAYLQGLVNNLLNPKGALFYLGIFTQVIAPETPPEQVLVLAVAMLATSALFWIGLLETLEVAPIRGWVERFRLRIERAFGALLIAIGVRVAVQD